MKVSEIIDSICASLWMLQGSAEELKQREFLHNTSLYGIEILLQIAENKGLIYEKSGKYYCYKKTAKKLNSKGFELDLGEKYESDFEKAFRKSNR